MNIEKIVKESVRDDTMSANYTIKLHEEMKEAFIDKCDELALSPGKVLRNLMKEFLERV